MASKCGDDEIAARLSYQFHKTPLQVQDVAEPMVQTESVQSPRHIPPRPPTPTISGVNSNSSDSNLPFVESLVMLNPLAPTLTNVPPSTSMKPKQGTLDALVRQPRTTSADVLSFCRSERVSLSSEQFLEFLLRKENSPFAGKLDFKSSKEQEETCQETDQDTYLLLSESILKFDGFAITDTMVLAACREKLTTTGKLLSRLSKAQTRALRQTLAQEHGQQQQQQQPQQEQLPELKTSECKESDRKKHLRISEETLSHELLRSRRKDTYTNLGTRNRDNLDPTQKQKGCFTRMKRTYAAQNGDVIGTCIIL